MIKIHIIYGRRHGNGKHGCTYQRIVVKFSDSIKSLIEYEHEQLAIHGNKIYERDFTPSWMLRACPRCFMTYMVKRSDGTWECPKCGVMKIPKNIWREKDAQKGPAGNLADLNGQITRRNGTRDRNGEW